MRTKGIVELDATFRTSGESLIDVIVALHRAVLLEYRCSRNPSHTEASGLYEKAPESIRLTISLWGRFAWRLSSAGPLLASW